MLACLLMNCLSISLVTFWKVASLCDVGGCMVLSWQVLGRVLAARPVKPWK